MSRGARFVLIFIVGAVLIAADTLSSPERMQATHEQDCAWLGFSVFGSCR